MSFDTFQLPPFIIQELFKHSLYDLNNHQSKPQNNSKNNFSVLGSNKKHILIIIENEETLFLPDDQFNFLLGILSACKLTMEDIGILNYAKNSDCNYKAINDALNPEIVLLFGVAANQLELPINVPNYQIQVFNNQKYIFSPTLIALESDRTQKLQLWESLKKLFLT